MVTTVHGTLGAELKRKRVKKEDGKERRGSGRDLEDPWQGGHKREVGITEYKQGGGFLGARLDLGAGNKHPLRSPVT